MKLFACSYVVLMSLNAILGASVKDSDRKLVKRQADVIPGLFSGAVDMTLDLIDRFGQGFGARASSKTDALGFHDEREYEIGTKGADNPQERKKRSPIPCGKQNETLVANGTNSNVNRRNSNSSEVETLLRRKRSAQQPNSPPPNGPPPNGPPPNGPPPNGPPGNCTRPGNIGQTQNGTQPSSQTGAPPSTPSVRRKRESCNNATELNRSKRSPQRPNDNSPNTLQQQDGDGQQQGKDYKSDEREGWNVQNENKNLNGYGGVDESQNENPSYRVKRSAKPCTGQNGAPTNNSPQLPQQQPQQQVPTTTTNGVNIADLQRDQNQRTRRDVSDPDKVIPTNSNDDKNLFERIVQVVKEIVARVTKWADDVDKERATVNPKTASERPKL